MQPRAAGGAHGLRRKKLTSVKLWELKMNVEHFAFINSFFHRFDTVHPGKLSVVESTRV